MRSQAAVAELFDILAAQHMLEVISEKKHSCKRLLMERAEREFCRMHFARKRCFKDVNSDGKDIHFWHQTCQPPWLRVTFNCGVVQTLSHLVQAARMLTFLCDCVHPILYEYALHNLVLSDL